MNLDELRSVRRTERQKDSLQHLRDSFYEDVAAYIAERKAERRRAADEAAEPFDDPAVGQLTDEIETAEDVVESIYERRVGKVVKLASFAAADMSADTDGLTAEERDLFDDLVARIKQNRGTVLDVLAGEGGAAATQTGGARPEASPATDPSASTPPTPSSESSPATGGTAETPADPSDGTTAAETQSTVGANGDAETPDDVLAEAMGVAAGSDDPDPESTTAGSTRPGATAQSESTSPEVPPDAPPDAATRSAPVVDSGSDDAGRPREPDGGVAVADPSERAADPDGVGTDPSADVDSDSSGAAVATGETDRVTLRITEDVGQILGVDEREYDLASEDVVTLPATNAGPLLDRDAAERLD
ncbi:hypothetical protein DVK02_06490 [Halobellus sp. Atlit-31R]|nr:hypothetical protein DVK02_06490 [Halobellus sp. Atlit-31R]